MSCSNNTFTCIRIRMHLWGESPTNANMSIYGTMIGTDKPLNHGLTVRFKLKPGP